MRLIFDNKKGLSGESLEKALGASLTLMFVLAVSDLALYQWYGSAILTVLAHFLSLVIYFRHQLRPDFVKMIEAIALVIDAVLIFRKGFAVASPLATLCVIVYIGLNRESHLQRMKQDLEKVFSSHKK